MRTNLNILIIVVKGLHEVLYLPTLLIGTEIENSLPLVGGPDLHGGVVHALVATPATFARL